MCWSMCYKSAAVVIVVSTGSNSNSTVVPNWYFTKITRPSGLKNGWKSGFIAQLVSWKEQYYALLCCRNSVILTRYLCVNKITKYIPEYHWEYVLYCWLYRIQMYGTDIKKFEKQWNISKQISLLVRTCILATRSSYTEPDTIQTENILL